MNKIFRKIIFASLHLCIFASLVSCSDTFLTDKKDYDNVSEAIYNTYSGAQARVNDIYSWCLPNTSADASWRFNCTGRNDDQSKSTEEYSGFGCFVNPENPLGAMTGTMVPDYFENENKVSSSPWGTIRNINDVIRGIENGTLSQEEKNELLGQVYFFRAWKYFQLVKWYGGVPIIKDVLEAKEGDTTPRSSTKACIDFICDDLDRAAEMLKASTTNGGWASSSEDWGRVTSGTAMALKGRVLLYWASPIFNRKNDTSRWQAAYDYIKSSLSTINACGYGLVGENDPGVNASSWAGMFSTIQSKEAVFVSLYNTLYSTSAANYSHNNYWEGGIRPQNTCGSGSKPSAMLIDMFPMKDGKKPNTCTTYTRLDKSKYEYNDSFPFMNRDPRFYRTFAFPGVRWAYNGDVTTKQPESPSYDNGNNYELWNYVWYQNAVDSTDAEMSGYAGDNLLSSYSGMYIRKRSDDFDVNGSPLYVYDTDANGFKMSAAPYMEIRYAEVLLNYAEAAAAIGETGVAVEQLKRLRQRVGYTGDCGLEDLSDPAKCMSAVLYERQIELAYEGKRFDDMRRWLLFDGGANFSSIEGAPSTWTLEGWNGNTCDYLGFTKFNGQRRDNMEFRLQGRFGLGGTTKASDPLLKQIPREKWAENGLVAIDLRQSLDAQQTVLQQGYRKCFVRKEKKGDSWTSSKGLLYVNHLAKYYLLGLRQRAMSDNPGILQTIGWEDYHNGGANGTFDPLAE